jgi:hypothetical protein
VFTAMVFLLFLVDLMFLNDNEFVFDPNYHSWQTRSGTDGREYTHGE